MRCCELVSAILKSSTLARHFCRHKILAVVAGRAADCGDAYFVRNASDTRITLVKKRSAWYLRVKLKPHNELPCIAKVKSSWRWCRWTREQACGLWKKVEGSGSSGPAVPKDVEESEPAKRLAAPTAPTAADREEHTASGHAVFRSWCRECCIGRACYIHQTTRNHQPRG